MGDIEEESGGSQVSPPFGRHDQETWLDRNQRHKALEALWLCDFRGCYFLSPKASQKNNWVPVPETPVDGGDC